jgi:hypothetical protein
MIRDRASVQVDAGAKVVAAETADLPTYLPIEPISLAICALDAIPVRKNTTAHSK